MAHSYADARELANVLQGLAARSASDQARALERYRDLLGGVASGELDAAAVRAQYDRLVAEQSAELTRDLTALGVRYYQSLIDLNRSYLDRLFDELTAADRVSRHPAHDDDERNGDGDGRRPPAVMGLHLRGPAGGSARAGFVVENKRREATEVRFLVSDVETEDDDLFRARVELDPPRFRLAPHAEREVSLAVHLDADLFVPGRTYHAEVLARANDEFTLRLTIEVDEASPEADA